MLAPDSLSLCLFAIISLLSKYILEKKRERKKIGMTLNIALKLAQYNYIDMTLSLTPVILYTAHN